MNIHERQQLGLVIVELIQDECDHMQEGLDILMAIMLQMAVEMNIPKSKVVSLMEANYDLAVDINLEEDMGLGAGEGIH